MELIPTARIARVEESEEGTFSVMTICNQAFCVTLEPPDFLNKVNVSNIPPGQYLCKKVNSPQFGITFEIINVPDRSHVLFHSGNRIEDTEGCVILAQHFGKLHGDRAVLNSGATFKEFMDIMKDVDVFSLTIKEVY